MAVPNNVFYKFYGSCGTLAEISNDGKTGQRRNPQSEFNNAVLISSEPLAEGVLFEIRIDKKVTSWTGSIIIGVTTTAPERFKFPTTVSALSEGCWILSGTSVLKDGKQSITDYTQLNAETLNEGDVIGMMRRGSALHFYINGQDLGLAETKLPSKIYALVDLYGRCAKVTIVQPSQVTLTSGSSTVAHSNSSTPSASGELCFHTRAGTNVRVIDNGMKAQRKAAVGEFNNAVVVTNRPLRDCELFEVQLKSILDRWAGSIEIGLTTHSPTTITFPSTLTNLSTGAWLVSGSSVIHNGDIVRENIGKNLDQLQVGDYVGVMRNSDCTMTLFVNGREVGVACRDIPPGVYGIADLYGRCVEVAMANRTQNNRSDETIGDNQGSASGTGNQQATNERVRTLNETEILQERSGNQQACRTTGPQSTENTRIENGRGTSTLQATSENQRPSENQPVQVSWMEAGSRRAGGVEPVARAGGVEPVARAGGARSTSQNNLKFHTRCGVNVELSGDQARATRKLPYSVFTAATVFTHRPLLPGEWFEVMVSISVECWNGSLRLGVCATSPDELTITPTTDAMSVEHSWVLCGHELYHHGNRLEPNYQLDLNEVSDGSTVGVMVTRDGDLHFSLNGLDMGCAVRGVPTDIYGMVDVYGQCSQVQQQGVLVTTGGDHVTTGGDHVTPATSIQPSVQSMVEGVTIVPSTQMAPNIPVRSSLHSKCGTNIQLTDNGTIACRLRSYKDGVVFSAYPLQVEEMFTIEVIKLADNWKGFIRIGLTTCAPDSFSLVPSLSTLLPPYTWIVNGSTVTENGTTVTETYGAALCRIQVKDTVGIQLLADSTMHIYLNGEDLGVAATINGISERLYAVMDLYGPIAAVKVTGAQRSALAQQAPPELLEMSQQPVVEQEAVAFAPLHSENIELEHGGLTACRVRSYSKGLVVTSAPLPCDKLFQVTIVEMNSTWNGSLSIGVTVLTPAQVISVIKAKQLPGQSFVIAASTEKSSVLYIGGQEMDHLPTDVNLLALKAGDTVGLLCKCSGTLHFFLNGAHIAKLPCTVPKGVYGVVDLYGQCVKVTLKPLTPWSEETSSYQRNASLNQQRFFSAQAPPFSLQAFPSSMPQPAKRPPVQGPSLSPKRPGLLLGDCSYHSLCNELVRDVLLLPEAFFASEDGGSQCLCKDCRVKYGRCELVESAGNPKRRYTLPFGWVEYKLKLPPRAHSLRAAEEWNVAYHGTAAGNVRSILDCGGLLLPGDRVVRGDEVKRPHGHYTEEYRPHGFDVNRIFLTPSAKYCSLGEVYTKPYRCTISRKDYLAKVMFGVLAQPSSYTISTQTVDPKNAKIDEQFDNSELEWSTKQHVSIILHHLYVKLDPITQ